MKKRVISLILIFLLLLTGCFASEAPATPTEDNAAYQVLNNNQPEFTEDEITAESFERYSDLDILGRCGVAIACIGKDIMPTEERGAIGQIKPTGWHTVKYDHVDGKYLYNRCHLIGFQLTGENANERNLITGTRYLNTEGMLPFENQVAEYVNNTGNHVMYRVTPIFEGNNLLASGVQMEGWSIEDNGKGVCFNVYCFNIQPGVEIDYATGESKEEQQTNDSESSQADQAVRNYVLNTNSMKYHLPSCNSVNSINEDNVEIFNGTAEQLEGDGYTGCKNCISD